MPIITFTEDDLSFAEIVEAVRRGTLRDAEAISWLEEIGYSRRAAHWWLERIR